MAALSYCWRPRESRSLTLDKSHPHPQDQLLSNVHGCLLTLPWYLTGEFEHVDFRLTPSPIEKSCTLGLFGIILANQGLVSVTRRCYLHKQTPFLHKPNRRFPTRRMVVPSWVPVWRQAADPELVRTADRAMDEEGTARIVEEYAYLNESKQLNGGV